MTRLLLLLALAAAFQDPKAPPAPKVDQNRIDNAIDKGAAYLLKQAANGLQAVKHEHGGEIPTDELVFYTLIHAGVDPADPTFQALLDKLLEKELTKTYSVSLMAMGLETYDRKKYQYRIAQCAQFLVDNQCENGQWDYGQAVPLENKKPPPKDVASGDGKGSGPSKGKTESLPPPVQVRRRSKGRDKGDNSNAQYAALGIRACLQANVAVPPDVLATALKWWESNQVADGSWGYGYMASQDTSGYGSMTAGGVGAMIIYKHFLRQDYRRDPKVAKGLEWLGKNFTVKENPKYQDPKVWHLYWLYAVERVGMLFGTETLGKHEWYPEGANFLLDAQRADGSWSGLSMGGPVADTCFAILFLRRATKPLPKVASGGR